MPSNPLTHHEIIKLVEPFTRRGLHLDLSASNRLERRLLFKPVERCVDLPDELALVEVLQLESVNAGFCRLTRVLSRVTDLHQHLEARLVVEGERPADLLASLESIAPERQFGHGSGFTIAKSFRFLEHETSETPHAAPPRMILSHIKADVRGLLVIFTAPVVKADPDGLIELIPGSESFAALPEDLLAVLGWEWGLLAPKSKGWKSRLRLRGGEPRRSEIAERKIDRMIGHIAQTLGEAPARYHERLSGARWRVALRRSIPLILSILLVAGAFATSSLNIAEDSQLRLLVLNAPPVLLVLFFCMREIPSIEIPPIPKRSKALGWGESGASSPLSSQKSLWRG